VARIELEQVCKRYGDGTRAVDGLDLAIDDGEFMVLVGPSGCGKTTALRMVAGLEQITDGEIRIGGDVVNDRSPKDRDVAMVFQSYALYPHMTVEQNLAFGLKLRGLPKPELRRRVAAAAATLGLGDQLSRKPGALSGGQRQRVAMGRAIVREPRAYLMDEPLSNLDAKLRVQMRAEIQKLQRTLGVTTIYVTHDQVEAMTMGDRIAVMAGGRLQQVDTPERVYRRPANRFVAGFIGSPAMNMATGRVVRDGDGLAVELGEHRLPARADLVAGADVVVGVRPEDLAVGGDGAALDVVCVLREALGAEVLVHFAVAPCEDGALVDSLDGGTSTFVARLSGETEVRVGELLRLTVDPRRLHFFDPVTGDALADVG
jgi:multiple sugar transport system ATP-binding protein